MVPRVRSSGSIPTNGQWNRLYLERYRGEVIGHRRGEMVQHMFAPGSVCVCVGGENVFDRLPDKMVNK